MRAISRALGQVLRLNSSADPSVPHHLPSFLDLPALISLLGPAFFSPCLQCPFKVQPLLLMESHIWSSFSRCFWNTSKALSPGRRAGETSGQLASRLCQVLCPPLVLISLWVAVFHVFIHALLRSSLALPHLIIPQTHFSHLCQLCTPAFSYFSPHPSPIDKNLLFATISWSFSHLPLPGLTSSISMVGKKSP